MRRARTSSTAGACGPRPEPRIAGRERQDLDGRAAGELSSALWPGTEFGKRQGGDMPMLKQATRLPNTAGAGAGGGAGAARAQAGGARGHDSAGAYGKYAAAGGGRDRRRYEGVNEPNYLDPVASGVAKAWEGPFGGPFRRVGGETGETLHPWDVGYGREVLTPMARVG